MIKNIFKSSFKLRKKILTFVIVALIVTSGLLLYGDISKVGPALGQFSWPLLPAIITLTLLDDVLRYLRWDYLLRTIGVKISKKDSVIIFLCGLAMTITPGKLGELFKAYLAEGSSKKQLSETMPVVLVERVIDVMAIIILSSIGAIYFRFGMLILLTVGAFVMLFVLIVQHRRLSLWFIKKVQSIEVLQNIGRSAENFYESSYELLKLKRLIPMVFLTVLAWGSECFGLFLVFQGLGNPQGLLFSTFTFSFSSLMGAISMLPGGLGVAEGSLTGLMVATADIARPISVAATLIIRLSTMWLALALGLVTLIAERKKVESMLS